MAVSITEAGIMFRVKPVFMQVMALLKEKGCSARPTMMAENAEPIKAGTAGTFTMMLRKRIIKGSKQMGLIL